MKYVTDDDLTLLYYGEHDDPGLAARVAGSEELSARFDALSAELKLADEYLPPGRGDDYGSHVWQRIAPELSAENTESKLNWKSWLSALGQPRFSLAGVFSLAIVAVLAFMLGRSGDPGGELSPLANTPGNSLTLLGEVDPTRLLTQKVSGHLENVNLVLTQFVNTPEVSANAAEFATDMLVTNRLYRRAAAAQGNQKLEMFLAGLEPLLIELAYDAQSRSPASHERIQREISDGLLFRVRVFNQQLAKTGQTI